MEQLKSLTECMWLLERSVISMTRKEFESKSFEEVMEQLNEECDEVVSYRITCNNGNQRTLINP